MFIFTNPINISVCRHRQCWKFARVSDRSDVVMSIVVQTVDVGQTSFVVTPFNAQFFECPIHGNEPGLINLGPNFNLVPIIQLRSVLQPSLRTVSSINASNVICCVINTFMKTIVATAISFHSVNYSLVEGIGGEAGGGAGAVPPPNNGVLVLVSMPLLKSDRDYAV